MRSSLMRTAIVTSLLTALVVTCAAMYIAPRLASSAKNDPVEPAVYQGASAGEAQAPATTAPVVANDPQLRQRPVARQRPSAIVYSQAPAGEPVYRNSTRDTSGEPVTRHHRSTRDSVLSVAGSAGTGAAIGALAGGGKGAGIGALAGGVGGLIYDRITANK